MKARSLAKFTVIAVLAVIVVLLGGYYAVQWRAHRAVETALAQLPGGITGSAGATHYDIFGRVLTVDRLALIRDGQPWLDVAKIVLVQPDGAGAAANPWRAKALVLNDITGHAADLPQHVGRVVGRDLQAYADPGAATPLAALTGLRVQEASAIEVNDLKASGGSFGQLKLQGLKDGKAATATANNLTIQDGDGETRIASAEAADLDLDGLAAFSGHGTVPDAAARRVLAGRVALRDIVAGKAGEEADHVGTLALTGLQAPAVLPACADASACLAAALGQTAMDALVLTDINLQSSSDAAHGETASVDGQLQAGRLSLDHFDAGKIGLFDVTDVGFVSSLDGSSLGLRHFKVENADLSALLQAQQGGHGSDDVEADLRQIRVPNALIEDFTYRSAPDAQPLTIARIDAANSYGADEAVQTRLAIRHLVVAMPPPEQSVSMGLPPMAPAIIGDHADLAVDFDYSLEPSTQSLDIERLRLALNDAGALTLRARLEGFDTDDMSAFEDNPVLAGLTLLQRTHLTDAVLRFDNQTLVNRIIERAAIDNGIQPDEVRQGIRQQLPALAELMPWQADVVDQAEAFLAQPRSLTLTLRPATPVPLIDLAATFVSGRLAELQPTLKAN